MRLHADIRMRRTNIFKHRTLFWQILVLLVLLTLLILLLVFGLGLIQRNVGLGQPVLIVTTIRSASRMFGPPQVWIARCHEHVLRYLGCPQQAFPFSSCPVFVNWLQQARAHSRAPEVVRREKGLSILIMF